MAATARDVASLDDLVQKFGDALLPIALDVTDREADFAAVARAHDHFGGLDIVVNNAGYGHFGMIEELSEDEARAQIETNLFGALWVTQAALALPPRAGQRPHHPGLVDRRHLGVPAGRDLPRLQVGARRLQPGTRPGSGGLRDPCDAGGARCVLDRLGRIVVEHLRAPAGVRRGPSGHPGDARAARERPRRPRGDPRGDPAGGGRRGAAPARVLRRRCPSRSPRPTTSRG